MAPHPDLEDPISSTSGGVVYYTDCYGVHVNGDSFMTLYRIGMNEQSGKTYAAVYEPAMRI